MEVDLQYIVDQIQLVLDRTHTNIHKRKIRVKNDRLVFACPICGDSGKNMQEKRGHLFFNNLRYKCYNEGCRSTFTGLCKQSGIQIDPIRRLEIVKWIDHQTEAWLNQVKLEDDEVLQSTFDKLLTTDQVQTWFNSGKGPLGGFMPINYGSKSYLYLKGRGLSDKQMSGIYEGVKHNGKWHEPYLVFINRIGDKIISIQERNLESGYKRRFRVWQFSELYEAIVGEELDPIEQVQYNKVGQIYNIFSINYDLPITLFEGYLDSIWFKNSVAAIGVNADWEFLLQSDLKIRFFFDKDYAGQKAALAMLKRGWPVFLWQKLKEDWSRTDGDYWTNCKWFDEEIKDMNDIAKKLGLEQKDLEKYWSSSLFDQRWLNLSKPIYKKEERKAPDWDAEINNLLKNDTR